MYQHTSSNPYAEYVIETLRPIVTADNMELLTSLALAAIDHELAHRVGAVSKADQILTRYVALTERLGFDPLNR